MRLDGRRESSNVEDRRGLSGGAKVGIGGIGGIIIAALFAWMSGGDPLQAGLQAAQQQMQAPTETVGEENFTQEEQELASDCKKILASTEEVWTRVFQDQGWGEYQCAANGDRCRRGYLQRGGAEAGVHRERPLESDCLSRGYRSCRGVHPFLRTVSYP